jgi:hypothetical protein
MGISTVSGLPAHPLFVHLPVIGIPLTALALLAYILLPARRATLFWVVGVLTIIVTGATILAANSGEQLESMMSPEDRNSALVHKHTQLGDQTQTIVIIFAGVTLAYLALDWWRRRNQQSDAAPSSTGSRSLLNTGIVAFAVLALALGSIATVWDVRTGDAGAKAAWHDAVPATTDSASTTP